MARSLFENEKDLVLQALESSAGYERLVAYMTPRIEMIAKKYETDAPIEDLVAAGFLSLDRAMKAYARGLDEGKTYVFSTYYSWWARTGITKFLTAQQDED